MAPKDRKRFALQLVALAEIYGKVISEPVAEMWFADLQRFDIDAIEAAFARHRRSPDVGQFMPKPADVIRMLEGTSIDVAMIAWAKVDRAVRSIGGYQSVAFDDALVHRVVHDMGGWIGLCSKNEAEWPFVGNEFRTRYTAFRSRQEAPEYPSRLVGIAEADNVAKGHAYAVGEVVLVGDPERARQVVAGGTDKPAIGFERVQAPALTVAASNVTRLPAPKRREPEVVGEVR